MGKKLGRPKKYGKRLNVHLRVKPGVKRILTDLATSSGVSENALGEAALVRGLASTQAGSKLLKRSGIEHTVRGGILAQAAKQ